MRATWPGWPAFVLAMLLAGCTAPVKQVPQRTPAEVRQHLLQLLPPGLEQREGWARDIEAAFTSLELLPSTDNLCAALAVIEQETGYRADPAVPGLPKIARRAIDERAAALHIPKLAVDAALKLPSGNGQSFAERIAALRTEKDMSDMFVELVARVPLGERLFGHANPVRTGGSMQVAIDFAERHARQHRYPYGEGLPIRDEVFTRRGGVYFGIAHLLQYPASYTRHIHRYADFNAGWYASRNAAFQQAVSLLSGQELVPDGDLRLPDAGLLGRRESHTEAATMSLADQLGLSPGRIRRDLARERDYSFEETATWRAVFAAADARTGQPLPRAVIPRITLKSPKITRTLTTGWFAQRVQARYQQCINRAYR